jgi:hypothetical protein
MNQEAAGALATAKPVVFISHSTKDKAVANRVCDAVEAAGIRCWIAPRDILPGSDWGMSILQAINTCTVMVLVFSGHTNTSPQIRREVELAVEKGLMLIPMRIEEVRPAGPLEYFLRSPQWMDAFSLPIEPHVQYLVRVLRNVVAPGGAAAVAGAAVPGGTPPVVMPGGAPLAAATEAAPAVQFDPAVLQALQPHLARHVGPIAQRLIATAAHHAADYHALCAAVAEHIPDGLERRQFLDEMLHAPHAAVPHAHVPEAAIAHAVKELTHFLGPIARVLVMRTQKGCGSAEELWELLSAHIESPADRAAFLGTRPKG